MVCLAFVLERHSLSIGECILEDEGLTGREVTLPNPSYQQETLCTHCRADLQLRTWLPDSELEPTSKLAFKNQII